MAETQVATIPRWADTIGKTESKFLEIIKESGSEVSFAAESMFAFQIVGKNDYMQKVAIGNLGSLRDAIINVAAIGLSLNPAMQYAYLVPRDGMVCLDISYKGLIKLATDTGSMMWVRADLVYKEDHFIYHGPAKAPVHEANVFGERGPFVGVYCIAKTLEGDILTEVMTAKEIDQVKSTSKAGMKGPWKDWFGEMAKKTIIKRASKTWPRSDKHDRLAKAIEVLNDQDGMVIDQSEAVQCLTDEQILTVQAFLEENNIPQEKALRLGNVSSLEEISPADFDRVMSGLKAVAQ